MKQSLPWIVLSLYCLLGLGLLIRMSIERPAYVIHTRSNFAIINVSDPEMADALANGEIEIKTRNPDDKVLLRVTSGNPTHIWSAIRSEGNVQVINPAGIIVGNGDSTSQFDSPSTSTRAEIIPHGNVYALAIREGGAIRAKRSVEVSTVFAFDSLEESRVIFPPNPTEPAPSIDDR